MNQLANELHKQKRINFPRRKVLSKYPFQILSCDLIEVHEFKSKYKYGLTCIDLFSRYAWVKPLTNKRGKVVTEAFAEILNDPIISNDVQFLWTDRGLEFKNQTFLNLLKKHEINLYHTDNQKIKGSVIERFNRTFKTWLYKEDFGFTK